MPQAVDIGCAGAGVARKPKKASKAAAAKRTAAGVINFTR